MIVGGINVDSFFPILNKIHKHVHMWNESYSHILFSNDKNKGVKEKTSAWRQRGREE